MYYSKTKLFGAIIGLILLTSYTTTKILDKDYLFVILATIGMAVCIYHIYSLPSKTNRKLAYFLNAVKNNDTTLTYPNKGTREELELNKALNRLNAMIKENKMISEEKEIYFQTIINQATTGLLIREGDTKIAMANQAILDLCKLPVLYHINQLDRVSEKLKKIIETIEPGKEVLENITIHNERQQLSIHASKLTLRNKEVMLLSIRNLQFELDRNEIESWIKLIRVLTHEIMNTLAPITSVAQTLKPLFDKEEITSSTITMTRRGLGLINEQSVGLTKFVNNYRSLTQVPEPTFEAVYINDLFIKWENYGKELSNKTIEWHREEVDQGMILNTDPQMLTRISSNLIKNAIEATQGSEHPKISLGIKGGNKITISNNGDKIEDVVLENIWVPFFTTKQSGSGIGLSLCKQIAKKLNLQLSVQTSDLETTFEIKCNNISFRTKAEC